MPWHGAVRGSVSVTCHHLPTLSGRWPHISVLGTSLSKPWSRSSSGRTVHVSELCSHFSHGHTSPGTCSQHLAPHWNSQELWEPLANLGQRENTCCSHSLTRSVFHLQNHLVRGKIQEHFTGKNLCNFPVTSTGLTSHGTILRIFWRKQLQL